MAESTPLELVYAGEEVEDGSIPVDYMIDALTGFSSAYEKVSGRVLGPDAGHRIRVIGLQQSSTHILLNVIEWVRQNPAAGGVVVAAGSAVSAGAYKVITDIARYIGGKKHLAGAPVEPSVQIVNQNIFLMNSNGEPYELTKQQMELLREGLLEPDLDKLTRPLDDVRVNAFEIRTQKKPVTRVTKEERPYFFYTEKTVTSSRDDVWMEGTLNSLSKDRNRGTFHTTSGRHLAYRYIGNNQQQLFQAFAYDGTVRARGKVSFDSELNPVSIEISAIQIGQRRLFEERS